METDKRVEKERLQFKQLILENPNYFGTYPGYKLNAVNPMQGNTKYEELQCLGLYPEEDILEAIFDVKLSYGFGGPLCSDGTFEYIRFYIDWDGDGDFDEPEEDVGIVSVNVHNIPDEDGACRDKAKPLSFALRLRIDPEKRPCWQPYLVKVRAILEWNRQPPAGTPDHPPIWGNVLERWVQIEPREHVFGDFLGEIDLDKYALAPEMIDKLAPVSRRAEAAIDALREQYQGRDVPEHRISAGEIAPIVAHIKDQPHLIAKLQDDPAFAKLWEVIKAYLYGKPEVKYEELTCLGLDHASNSVAATIHVKQPSGYLGNKCRKGTYEHVAFWLYVYDKVEQDCRWTHLGTSSVNVHDIEDIPDEGLHYAVYQRCDLSWWQESCTNAVVLKLRAILSWNEVPSPLSPNWEPRWGNVKDVLIQLKPGDEAEPGKIKPYIWSVGDMGVEKISGNYYSVVHSVLGDGFANDVSVTGVAVKESPFAHETKITGGINNAPNIVSDADKLRYKVQYRKVDGGTGWHDMVNTFEISLRVDNEPAGSQDQINVDGYYSYECDPILPDTVQVQDDLMAIWETHKAEGDGLYELRIAVEDPGAPGSLIYSRIIRAMVDNTSPEAKISLTAGPCTKFEVGQSFGGLFTAMDEHIHEYTITIEPATADMPVVTPPTSGTYPLTLPAPGLVDEAYTVTSTESTTPCGYVIRLRVWDRAIRKNRFPGNSNLATVGLCLLEEGEGEG